MEPRTLSALWAAFRAFWRGVWRIVRQLFHEVTGALFAVFALIGALGTWREWRTGGAGWVLTLPALFTLMMTFFAVSAFLSARRLEKIEK